MPSSSARAQNSADGTVQVQNAASHATVPGGSADHSRRPRTRVTAPSGRAMSPVSRESVNPAYLFTFCSALASSASSTTPWTQLTSDASIEALTMPIKPIIACSRLSLPE